MGGESKSSQTQNSTTAPWDPAQPAIKGMLDQIQSGLGNTGITGAETGALNTIAANGQASTASYAPQIADFAKRMLAGGGAQGQDPAIAQNLADYRTSLTPFANGSMVGHNPALDAQLAQIRTDVGDSINGQFAAAGRDFSGANQMAYGRGIAAGEAPVIAGQYNTDIANQRNAQDALYGAGNTTSGMLGGTQAQANTNAGNGITASGAATDAAYAGANATVQAEAARRGIPIQALGLLAQIGIPIAGLGGQSTGQSNGTQQMSGAQQFATIAGGIGSMIPKGPMSFSF